MLRLVLLGILFLNLSACMTAATSSAQAIYNHKNLESNIHDQYITMRAYQALDIDCDYFKDANINVSTFNHTVLLTGQVPKPWQKKAAAQIIKKIAEGAVIYNVITVQPPIPPWVRLSDAWITTKIKTKLMSASDIDATRIKVITENGTVYLMGILPVSEAEEVVNAARDTEGVHAVVRVFSYVKISKKPV